MRTYAAMHRGVLAVAVIATFLIAPQGAAAQTRTITATLPTDAINQVNTSNPSLYGGMNVNTYLGANRFYEVGITGQNTIVANVEAGRIWNGHETLGHATSYVAGGGALGDYDRHATAVGMIIGGRNGGGTQGNWQKGMAYGTDLRSGAMATAWTGTPYTTSFSLTYDSFYASFVAYFGTADVINSSWGTTDTGGASFITMSLDGMARANPRTTSVMAAGNSGPGANTVLGPASGFNGISVGALTNSNNTYNSLANFSSRSPQDYYDPVHGTVSGVRAAVDIVVPGDTLASAYYGGATGGNTGGTANGGPNVYLTGIAGTSYAAPIVAGGVALLDSASKVNGLSVNSLDARVTKAVLMNSADKVAGWTNGQSEVNGVVTTTQSLDWGLGAGRMNLSAAYDQYLSGTKDVAGLGGGSIASVGWDYGQLSGTGNHNDYLFNASLVGDTVLDVTLDWFRNRENDFENYDVFDNGFANLDLQIWDGSFQTLLATSESIYNSSELLHFMLPYSGTYGLRVAYTDQVFGTAVPEIYGLAWSATAVPEPTVVVMLVGLAIGWLVRRRRRF